MPVLQKERLNKLAVSLTVLLMLAVLAAGLSLPGSALAAPPELLLISGDGVAAPVTLTMSRLQEMPQYEHVYSTINTFPTKKCYVASGVKLSDLFDLAGISPEAKMIRFSSNDGYEVSLTVKELLRDKRYYFPFFMDNNPADGSIPGSPRGAREVEPILALLSAEDEEDPTMMNDRDALLLVVGQRAVTEQTNNLFLKYVSKIEVLTSDPPQWDEPKADIESGEVPAGTKIKLSNRKGDVDKIYYTTDGNTPTVNSPMYNWVASRWQGQREDLELVNLPIEVNEDTVIKAVTIGPGREDSEVVTFTYKADFTGKEIDLKRGRPPGITLDQSSISLKVGATEELLARVNWGDLPEQNLIYSSSDTRVVTVDSQGLVTRVGQGEAVISVRTADGQYTAVCLVSDAGPSDRLAAVAADLTPPNNGEPIQQQQQPALPEEQEEAAVVEEKTATTEAEETAPAVPEEPEQQPELPPVPEGREQYLAEKEQITPVAPVSLEQLDPGQDRYVFELTTANLLPAAEPQRLLLMDLCVKLAFVILLLIGAIDRYREYAREVIK